MKKIDINIVHQKQIALLSTAPRSDLRWWQRSVAGVVAAAMLFAPFKITVDEYLSIRVGYNTAAAADPIVDPYGPLQFRPGIVNSSAGVPVINITAPNAAGMSLNQFQRFEVDAAGLILNNSLTGGGSLQGGHVAGNTNLNGRPANLIINQIMGTGSAFASSLNGSIEVFGTPASVIIANPNGISCAGCGFINTQRVTLTTGAPQFLDRGTPTSFEKATGVALDVQSGRVEIGGNGIDGTLGRIDVIAETIGIDAALRAGLVGDDGQINLIAGRNRVADDGAGQYNVGAAGAANTAVAVKASNPTSASVQNSFAIDGSALGAMTAGQIKIIATTSGLGVKADGALASSMGNLSISANGEIRVNSVYAKQHLELDATGNLTVAGTALAEQDAKLSARGNLTLSGDVQTGRNLDVDATGNAQIDASLLAKQDATLTVGGRVAQTGSTNVGGDYVVRGNGVSTTGNTSVNGAIAIHSGSDVSFSNLSTKQTLNVEAQGNVAANGTTAAVGNATIASLSGDIDARGALSTAGNLNVSAQNNIAVAGGLLAMGDANINAVTGNASFSGALDAAQNLILSAGQDIATAGVTKVGGAAKIDAGGSLNLGGNIVVTGALDATAKGNFANSGQTLAGGDVTLKSGGAMHLSGDVASAGNLNLSAQNDVTAARALQADANMSLTATQGSILSQGGISVGRDSSVTAERDITINGDAIIQGNSNFTATQGSAAIDGNLGVNGNLVIDARNSARIAGNTAVLGEIDVTARTGDATFGGVVNTGNSLKVEAGHDLTTNGDLGVAGNATLNAGNDLTIAGVTEVMGNAALTATHGRLLTQGDLTANGLIVYAGGDIDLRGNLGVVTNAELIAGDNLITAGTVITGGNLFQRAGVDIDNNASLLVLGNLEAQAGRDTGFGGDLSAAQNVLVTAGRDATFAGITEVIGDATVQAISGDVAVHGSVAVDGATTLDAGRNLTTTSVLQSGQNLNAKAGGQATLGGSTTTNQNLTINAGSLNTQGDLTSHGTTTLTTTAGNLSNDGQLESAGDLVIVSAGDVSGNGNTLAKSNATVTAQGRVELTGSLEVAKALQIDSKNDIVVGEVSVLETASLTSRQGAIDLTGPVLTGGNLIANAKTSLQARDDVISLAAIALTAQIGPLVTNGELNAATDLNLISGGAMIINQVAGAQRDVSLNSGANLDLNADVSATRNLAIHSNGDLTGNAKLAGINTAVVSGRDVVVRDVKSTNATVVSATRNLTLHGEVSAMRGPVRLDANGVMNNNGAVNSGSSLTVNGGAGTINNMGTLIATTDTMVSAAALTNRGMIYGRNTTLNVGNVDNANGDLLAKDTLTANIGNLATNANGVIGAGDGLGGIGDLNVSASGTFNNAGGKFLATRDLSLNLPNATFDPSASGEVAAGGLLMIDAKSIANSGNWQPNAGSLSLTTQTDFSNSGTIQMDGDFRIRTIGNIANSGEILTGGAVRLDGQNVFNGNLLKADGNVELAGNVTNRGSVQAGAAVFISGTAFDNAFGKVQSDLYLNVDVAGVLTNAGGELRSKGSADIHAASIDNDRSDPVRGWRLAGFDTGLLNSLVVGDFAWDCAWWFGMCNGANNWMDYFPGAGSRIFNTESDLLLGSLNPDYATRQLAVENPNTGVITQVNLSGTVTMGADLAPGQAGTIIADYDLTMNAVGAISNRGGEIKAGRNLSIKSQSLDNGRAANVINAASSGADNVDLARFIGELNTAFGAGDQAMTRNYAHPDDNRELLTMPTFTVNPVSPGTPGAVGNIKVGGNANLTVASLEQRGNLTAAGNLTIASSTHMNNTGATAAGGGITIHAGGLTNQPGAKIVSQGDLNIQLGSGTLTNIGGSIQSMGGNLSLNAGAVLNKDAGATDDRYVFYDLASYVNATNTLVAEDDTRYRITHPESRDASGNYLSQVFHRGSNRIALYAPDNLYLDSGQSLRTLTLVTNRHESPGVISAANNLNVNASGSIDNQASVFSAGGALTAIGANINNLGAQNMTRLKIEAGEFTHYTVQSTAASTFQAGGALSVQSAGVVVNSGNIYGQAISISGAGLTNGETHPSIAPIASINPNAVINLGDPSLGRGILDAQDIVTLATSQSVNGAGTAAASFLNSSLGSRATTAVVDPQYVMLPTPNISAQPAALAVQVLAITPSFGSRQEPNLTGDLARHGEFVQPGIDLTQTVNQRVEAMAPSAAAHVQYVNASPVSEVLAPLTPAYLLQQLPAELVNGSTLFFYADPYVEQQLLRKAALQQTGQSYFINGLAYDDQYQVSADTQQQAILYDQAVKFATANNIKLGLALSPELQAKLDAPMLWYVEQKVKHKSEDGSEQDITALVPQVYLPELYRQSLTNQAGGVIEGDDVTVNVTGTVDNTGYLIAHNKLSITAQDFIQQHRQADIGRETENIDDGYVAITGTRLQPGGFAAGAEIELNVQRLQSIAGEFQVLGERLDDSQAKTETLLTDLRNRFGAQFETQAQDNLHYEAHVDKGVDLMQVVIIVVAIVITIYTAGAASALIASAVQTSALAAGATATAAAAAGTAAASSAIGVGLSAAAGSMAASAFTGLATGTFSVKNTLKAGLIAGLTAGLTAGIGQAIGSETLAGGELVNGNWVATDGVTSLSDKLIGYTVRAGIGSGISTSVNGGDFDRQFIASWVNSAAADGANWIGGHTEPSSFENIAAHGVLGCAAAAATDQDCASGAAGAVVAATLNPYLDNFTSNEDALLRRAQLAGLSALATGVIASAADLDVQTAIDADQNETLNNYLTSSQKSTMFAELARCGDIFCQAQIKVRYLGVSANQNAGFATGVGIGIVGRTAETGIESIEGLANAASDIPSTVKALKDFISNIDENTVGKLVYDQVEDYKRRLDLFEQNYETGGWDGSRDAGIEFGALITDGAMFATGIGGAAKLTAQLGIKIVGEGTKIAGKFAEKVAGNAAKDIATTEARLGSAGRTVDLQYDPTRRTWELPTRAISDDQVLALQGGKGPLTPEAALAQRIESEISALSRIAENGNSQVVLDRRINVRELVNRGEFDTIISQADVSSPVNGAVFWSRAKEEAQAYARSIGGVTLDMTPAGSIFDGWKYFDKRYPEMKTRMDSVWNPLSAKFAREASGEVTAVQRYEGPTWLEHELPVLKKNESVTEITIKKIE